MFSRLQPSVNGQNPRKRQKRSHEPEAGLDAKSNFVMPPTAGPSKSDHAPAGEQMCLHEQSLRKLEPDLEAMRQLITCKMCYCFLTEPYSLACGHTYCYICLDSWLVAQKKSTCPDCRAVVKQQPNPSFIVREMTMIFTSRAELLPNGETLEEHEKYATEAAAKVAKDKANGHGDDSGLFSGKFGWGHRLHFMPMHDPTDGVDRCPICYWEVEGGVCSGCGETMGDDAGLDMSDIESESSEEDLDHDIDAVDGEIDIGYDSEGTEVPNIDHDIFGAFPPIRPPVLGANSRRSRRPIALDDESDEESSDDDDEEHDSQMDSFIDDEASESGSESGESEDEEEEAQSTPHPRLHRRAPILIDSDDEQPVTTNNNPIYVDSDEEAGFETHGVGLPGRRLQRRQILSDDEDDDSSSDGIHDDEPEDEDHVGLGATPSFASSDDAGAIEAAGFSPVSVDTDDYPHTYETHEHYHDDENDQDDDDRQSTATAGYDSEAPAFEIGYGYDENDDEDDDEDDEDSDDIRATTPPNSRPAQVANTHRLNTNQRRRQRSHQRLVPHPEPRGGASPSANTSLATASGVLRAARRTQPAVEMPHPFQLSDTLARVNAQQRRVREGGSNQGGSRLRRDA